jgi:hypothetical protein
MVIPSRRTSFWEKEVGEKCEEDVYHTAPDYFVLIEVKYKLTGCVHILLSLHVSVS